MRLIEDKDLRQSMRPSNILVSGKSGSGKTEIFRQISRIYNAPFIRVEATKYTEVGYHGEDVQNIISDLFKKTHAELQNKDAVDIFRNSNHLKALVSEHICKIMMGPSYQESEDFEAKRKAVEDGSLDETYCYVYIPANVAQYGASQAAQIEHSAHKFKKESKKMVFRHIKVKEIKAYMYEVYADELFKVVDMDEFVKSEIENKGIVVIDEIDKLVKSQDNSGTTKASDEGVQYDLLPILDGTTVSVNKNVKINTRNMLFVGVGAFEKVKPTELAIELQGRLPVNAVMESLSEEDFIAILKDTKYNLLVQTIELLKIEGVNIVFSEDAILEIARLSVQLNIEENIGARRLRTVLDAVMEDINFEAPDFEVKEATVLIGKDYIVEQTKHLVKEKDLKKYMM